MSRFARVCETEDVLADADPAEDMKPSSEVPLPGLIISFKTPNGENLYTPSTT
jgi:hypothetical protein